MNQDIELSVNGKPLLFHMSTGVYNRYLNEVTPSNKIAPAENCLMRCVDKDHKATLKELLELPGACVQILSKLSDTFVPELDIRLGE